MRKVILLGILAVFIGSVGWAFIHSEKSGRDRRSALSKVVAVETAIVKTADLGDRVVFTGSIKAEERYDAAPKISGIIRSVNVNVGDMVKKGDVLAILDDDEYRLAVERAEAALLVARANAGDAESQLAIARRDYDRAENLWRERVISAQEFDKAEAIFKTQQAKLETAAANVRLSEAELKSAKVKFGYTRVVADWDEGPDVRVIGQRFLDAGGLVAANTSILSVLDIVKVKAIIAVSEKEYAKITPGDRVAVTTDAFPGRKFAGVVSRIPQELGALTREAEVEVAVDNPDFALKPGMFVRADIEFRRRDGAVCAPLEAVVRREDGNRGVYLVNDGQDQVAFRPVTEGIVDGNLVELIGADDMLGREVVILGQHLLKDGIAVRVAGAKAAGTGGGPPESAKRAPGGREGADKAGNGAGTGDV